MDSGKQDRARRPQGTKTTAARLAQRLTLGKASEHTRQTQDPWFFSRNTALKDLLVKSLKASNLKALLAGKELISLTMGAMLAALSGTRLW